MTVLAAGVRAYNLGPGTSLSAKLQAAMAALDGRSVNAASGQLNAFANAVQAHAGKKLTGELASFPHGLRYTDPCYARPVNRDDLRAGRLRLQRA